MTPEELYVEFETRFGSEPRIASAPGRVNLIGEHTDYNEGFVLPVAIELSTRVAFAEAAGNDLVVRSTAFPDEEVRLPRGASDARRGHWSDYVCGVLRAIEGGAEIVPPANLLVDGDVPVGSGLSSSASLEVATACAVLTLAGRALSAERVALLCHRVENEFVGVRCGIMDQFVAALARPGNALLLDCRSRETSFVLLPDELEIVIVDSGVRHELGSGQYNLRRSQCETAAATLGVGSLRDATRAAIAASRDELGDLAYRRARHVVAENERVLSFVAALREGEWSRLGPLMAESHASLRDDYEVSCRELDSLVELAGRRPSLIGARMTGGGFGGCTVNLVRRGEGAAFAAEVAADYEAETGARPRAWVTRAAGGAALA